MITCYTPSKNQCLCRHSTHSFSLAAHCTASLALNLRKRTRICRSLLPRWPVLWERSISKSWVTSISCTSERSFCTNLISHFNRWCFSSDVRSFDKLCNLVVLEQFKQSVCDYITTYINEHKITCPSEAAVLADEYLLTHKSIYCKQHCRVTFQKSVPLSPELEVSFDKRKKDKYLM